jgi:hypothetical protein
MHVCKWCVLYTISFFGNQLMHKTLCSAVQVNKGTLTKICTRLSEWKVPFVLRKPAWKASSWVCVVCILTRLWSGWPSKHLIPGTYKILVSLPDHPNHLWCLPSVPFNGYRGFFVLSSKPAVVSTQGTVLWLQGLLCRVNQTGSGAYC